MPKAVRPASPCTSWARASTTASARSTPPRWSSPPAAWARSSRPPPTRRSPPATGWRSHCGRRGGLRPRVRPVPPHGPLPRRRVAGPAAPGVGGGTGRGRPPRRRVRYALHARAARDGGARPARHRRQGHHPPDAAARHRAHVPRRPPLRRRDVGAALPHHPGGLPGPRHRPGQRADPGRPGRALRLRRHPYRPAGTDDRARSVRLRRGRVHRCARRQPAGLQLAPRRTGVRRAHRGRHRRGPPPRGRRGRRRAPGDLAAAVPRGPGHDPAHHDPRRRCPALGGQPRHRRGGAGGPAPRCGPGVRRGRAEGRGARRRGLGGRQPAPGLPCAGRGRPQPRGDPRLPLARGPARARRRELAPPPRRTAHPEELVLRRTATEAFDPVRPSGAADCAAASTTHPTPEEP